MVQKKSILVVQMMQNFIHRAFIRIHYKFLTHDINAYFYESYQTIIGQVLYDPVAFIYVINDCKRNFEKRSNIDCKIHDLLSQSKSARIVYCAQIFNLYELMDFSGFLIYGWIYESMVF